MGTYTWTITPNDIDREIQVWKDRKSGKLKNGWDFLAFNYDSEQIINVLKYGKALNKSVLITSSYLFWKADIVYSNGCNIEIKKEVLENKEEPIALIFHSQNQEIQFPVICYNSDKFSDITIKLYDKFPGLKEKINCFLHKGSIIDTSNTIEQNQIKNGDIILMIYN